MAINKITPQKSLENVIKESDLPQLAEDYGEIIVDGIMDDEVLKEIPILKTVVGIIKFANSLSKHFAAKKIYKFLFQLKSIPKEKREKKINEINSSNKYQSSVGEQLFELLDKVESDGKPEILGKIFAAYIEEKIDYQTFLKISHIIKNIFYYDLVSLKQSYDGKYLNHEMDIIDTLVINGLVQSNVDFAKSLDSALSFDDKGNKKKPEEFIKEKDTLTEIGKIIIEIGMK